MGKRKRNRQRAASAQKPRDMAKPAAPFNNPFGALSEVRDELPHAGPSGAAADAEQAKQPDERLDEVGLGSCGKLVVQREKKGRAGKTVTRITGLPTVQIDALAKQLKSALGCGATREGDDLVLLGSLVDRAEAWLEKQGARKVVVSGAAQRKKPPQAAAQAPPSQAPRSWREPTRRGDLEPGLTVDIVLKKDQRTGALTRGVIQDILTPSATHSRGIKVRLDDGSVGRVKWIVGEP